MRSSGIRVSVRLYLNERRSTCECFNVCCCFTVKIQFGCARLTSGRIVGVVVAALPASLSTQSACDKRLRKTEFRSSKGRRKKWNRKRRKRMRKWGQLYTKPRCISRIREREREGGMASEWRKRERRERVRASQLIVVSDCFTMLFALWTLHLHFPQNIYVCMYFCIYIEIQADKLTNTR